MKKCFVKKLLSSFLALTMVVTAVPANVVSATEVQQAQVTNTQNSKLASVKAAAKKASNYINSDKLFTFYSSCLLCLTVVFGGSICVLLEHGKRQWEALTDHKKKINKLIEEKDVQLKELMDLQREEFNKLQEEIKTLTQGLSSYKNATFSQFKVLSTELSHERKKMDKLEENAEYRDTLNGVINSLSTLGVTMPNFLAKCGWIGAIQAAGYGIRNYGGKALNGIEYGLGKTWNGTKYGVAKGWNATSTFFGDLFNGNSTSTDSTGSVPTPTPTPSSTSAPSPSPSPSESK